MTKRLAQPFECDRFSMIWGLTEHAYALIYRFDMQFRQNQASHAYKGLQKGRGHVGCNLRDQGREGVLGSLEYECGEESARFGSDP